MDAVSAAMMGIDINKIKIIIEGFQIKSLPLSEFPINEIKIIGNLEGKIN